MEKKKKVKFSEKKETKGTVSTVLTESDFRDIFQAKCTDTKTKYTDKLFERFYKHQTKRIYEKTFDMSGCALGPLSAKIIAKQVYLHPNFRVLSLSGNCIGNKGAIAIAELIKRNHTIISLDVSSNSIGDEGAAAIFQSLSQNKTLIHLNMSSISGVSRNSFGVNAITEMSVMLSENKILSELNISMTEIACELMDPLRFGLTHNSTLQHFNISSNNIRSKGANLILTSILSSQIKSLSLAQNHLKDDIAPHFESFLANNHTLEVLDLSGNALTKRFCASIALPLASGSRLRELNLSRNPLGGRGVSSLGPALRRNENLNVLNISSCQIETQGFIDFCRDLCQNTGLVSLCIANNPLLDEGVSALGEVIEEHPNLRYLDLELTEITDIAGCVIFDALVKSKSMRSISIKNNLVHDGIRLQKMLVANPNIRECNIELNDIDYKVTLEIYQAIEDNKRRWKEGQQQRVETEVNTMKLNEGRLKEVRQCIKEERQLITILRDKLKTAKEEVVRSRESKTTNLSNLEQRLENLTQEAMQLTCDNQTKSDELRAQVVSKDSEANAVSNRLARETDTFAKECKALSVLEQRITTSRSSFRGELNDLVMQLRESREKYEEARDALIEAWNLTKEIMMEKRKQEESGKKSKKDAPAPAGKTTRSKKSKK